MKKELKLSINAPCEEKFENFSPTARGGFCSSCSKEVIDFTSMTDQEIVNYFDQQEGKACGRFHTSQLKSYHWSETIHSPYRNYATVGVIGLSLASFLASSPANAQEQKPPQIKVWSQAKDSAKVLDITKNKVTKVKGIVQDNHGPLPGVSVLLKGTVIGTETDFDGNFTFPKPLKAGDVLLISYLGYETVEITIGQWTKNPLKVTMEEGGELLGCIITGEVQVERLFKSKRASSKKKKKKG